MNTIIRTITITLALGGVVAVIGCASQSRTSHRASMVDYLYPNEARPVDETGMAIVRLPVRVGLVFVPESGPSNSDASQAWMHMERSALSEEQRISLLTSISKEFQQLPYVRSVEVIPTQYLTKRGGFANLDQVHTMFGTDIIVLLSYDQAQFTDEGVWSVTYWTIVGAYTVPAEKNDTATMLDAAVYHVPSRKLLMRAPGTSRIKGSATLVNLTEQLRRDSMTGFESAATNLVANLHSELGRFGEKLKEQPDEYKVEARPGYNLDAMGVGAVDGMAILLVLLTGGAAAWSQRRDRS